jgi:hypothetical protein
MITDLPTGAISLLEVKTMSGCSTQSGLAQLLLHTRQRDDAKLHAYPPQMPLQT